MSLTSWGFGPDQQRQLDELQQPGLQPARVVRHDRAGYLVATEEGEQAARLAGRLRDGDPLDRPAVGDWVALDPTDPPTIRAVLPRRTQVVRQGAGREGAPQAIAANVDVLLVVAGLDDDLNARRLERYLALAHESGARPVIVLNKADAAEDAEATRASVERELRARTLLASARTGAGVDALRAELRAGETAALVGPSGVGKSSLANRLLGEDALETGDVRAHDKRGRHTTTARHLVRLPWGALLLDTPGMRELALGDAQEGIARAFGEIDALARECRFSDCRHESEPGCRVREEVDEARVAAWRKLQREAAHAAMRHQDVRRQGRAFGKMARRSVEAKRARRDY